MSKKRATAKNAATGKRVQALHLLNLAVGTSTKNDALPKKLRKELAGLLPKLEKAERKAAAAHRKASKKAKAGGGTSKAVSKLSPTSPGRKRVAGRRTRKRARR